MIKFVDLPLGIYISPWVFVVGWMVLMLAISGGIGRAVGKRNGRATSGMLWGAFLGDLGVLLTMAKKPTPELLSGKINGEQLLAGWHDDPFGRHQYRYFDGEYWTDDVKDYGLETTDREPLL